MSDVIPIPSTKSTESSALTPETQPSTSSSSIISADAMKTKVSSMEELKQKSPVVYNSMMMGIATSMIQGMQRQSEHLKQTIREGSDR